MLKDAIKGMIPLLLGSLILCGIFSIGDMHAAKLKAEGKLTIAEQREIENEKVRKEVEALEKKRLEQFSREMELEKIKEEIEKKSSTNKQSQVESNRSTGSYSNKTSRYDAYDVYEFDDPDDFADEWAEEFGDGKYDDGYDDAYEYWEDNY